MNIDDLPPSEISNLTDGQEIALSLLQMFTGTLSMVGSSTIVYKVMRNRTEARSYDRIMLGLSVCDIVASFAYAITPFMLPADSSQRVWARGTDATCTVLGFLTQFSFSAMFYNSMLSFYYLMTVRFGVKRQRFAVRYEPWIHAFTWIFFLGTAFLGVGIDLYGEFEINQGCWVGDYPTDDCDITGTCTGRYFGWTMGGVPTLFTFGSLFVNNVIIYCYVRNTLSKTLATSNAADRTETRNAHIRETAQQNFLYVFTFALCYTPAFAVRVVESVSLNANEEASIFPLLAVNSFLTPLQGMLNMFVYTRPNYIRVRAAYPELGRFWALRTACLTSDIPKLSDISNMSSRVTKAKVSLSQKQSQSGGLKGRSSGSKGSKGFESSLDVVEECSNEDADSVLAESTRVKSDNDPSRKSAIWDELQLDLSLDEIMKKSNRSLRNSVEDEKLDGSTKFELHQARVEAVNEESRKRIGEQSGRTYRSVSTESDEDSIETGALESLEVFRDAATSLRAIRMDGSMDSYNSNRDSRGEDI